MAAKKRKRVAIKSEKRERVPLKKRFAILCRVSTEKQEEKGESLSLQEKQLKDNVKRLGGIIPKGHIYSSKEHSSIGYDRKTLNKMLNNAKAGIYFDAVMVADHTRLGRNSKISRESIEKLKNEKIDLYFGIKKFDYYSPDDIFSTDILTAAAQYLVDQSAKKSIESKIERAKRGWPMQGKPYGRRLLNANNKDGDAIWEIIPEAKKEMQKAIGGH